MKKIFVSLITIKIFILMFFIESCSRNKIKKALKKRPDIAMSVDHNASQDFKDGWQDGCEVGMSAGANSFYKMFYKNNKADGNRMINSKDYEEAWTNAYWFCYRSDYIRQKSSLWGSYFQGYR
jgi:hypothetical protein